MAADAAGDRPVIIEPVDFRSPARARPRRSLRPWLVGGSFAIVLLALAAAGWFVLTAQQVRVTVEPAPQLFELSGSSLHFRLGERHLLRPGEYTVRASQTGHLPLEETITVGRGQPSDFVFVMEERPGLVEIECVGADDVATPLRGVRVLVDGSLAGVTPMSALALTRGSHTLRLAHDRYQDLESGIAVAGFGQSQTVLLELRPDWADVAIDSRPASADVRLDGELVGTTPVRLEVPSGPHVIVLSAEGHEPWRHELTVVAEKPIALSDVRLEPARGTLTVETSPPGATVMIAEAYAGTAPVERRVEPHRDLVVSVSLDGHEPAQRTVRLEPGATATERFDLVAQVGLVRLAVKPSDANLEVDGRPMGSVPPEITLTALEHELRFSRDGYLPETRAVRPRPDVPARLVVELEPVPVPDPFAHVPRVAGNGYEFVLVEPGPYTMGSSRREQGRQSNETLRAIRLSRPFLMGVHEVTNAQFRQFKPSHQSGVIERVPLNGGDRPAVEVTWDEAARFCNWLSARDGLPAAYVEVEEAMRAVEPMTSGYRLPTEAEWEYLARMSREPAPTKFPWGGAFPPPPRAGNVGDDSAASLLGSHLEGYDDGYAATAPVGSFDPNGRGQYDLAGNVAEWAHDFYSIYPYDADAIAIDPLGPATGGHRVIRGSSWRHASITTLRSAYRGYGAEPRDDLGFRIGRYITDSEGSHEEDE